MKILVIDIETTGFKVEDDLIVEVGAVLLDLETGCIETVFNQLVKEKGFGSEYKKSWVFENSDLKFEDVDNAEELDFAKLQNLFDEYVVTAWNSKFDFSFLENRGLILSGVICPMKSSINFFKLKGQFRNNYKWAKVQEAWDHLFPNSNYIEKHRGLDDAIHEAKIIHTLYNKKVWKI